MFSSWRQLAVLPRDAWLLCVGTLFNKLGSMVVPFLALYVTRGLGHGTDTASMVLGAYGVGGLVGGPLAGRAMRRVGPLWVLRTSMLVSGALLLVYPWARSISAILVLTLAWSMAAEVYRPAAMTLLAASVPPERTKLAFTLHRLAINLGESVGPALGGVLAGISFPLLFAVDGATSLLAGAWFILALRAVVPVPPPAGSTPGPHPLRDPRFRTALVAVLLTALGFLQLMGAVSVFLVRDRGLVESQYGLLWTVNTVLIVLVEVPLNVKTAHWSHARTLSTGATLMGAGLGLMGMAQGMGGAVAAMVVITLAEMVLFPGMSAFAAHVAPVDRRGEYMGWYSMTFSVAWTVAPLAGTALLDAGGPAALFGPCALMAWLAAVIFRRAASGAG